MFCPDCNRCNFATLQGFVNHCRIAHRLEFPNIEQCHRECGTHVDESEVPADHPCRRRHTGGSGIRRANRVQKAQPSTARKSKPTATTTTPSVAVTTPEKTKKPATAKKSVNKPRKAPVEHKIEVQEEEIDLDLDEDMIQEANMNFEREVSAAATKSVSTGFPVAPRSGKKYPTSMSRIFTDSSSNSEKNDSSSSDSDVSSSDSSSPSTSPVRKTVVQSYPRKRPAPRFISEDEDSDSDCYEYHKRRAAEVYQKFVDRSDRGRLYQTEQQYCQTQEIR
ncbi:hypothetical protein K7432_005318 [Basidiobolus ranarum]|uniref:C2H2-type domain-containing protein n=1 Tax=Basidiobolus ranarum TaxID=34480 RepID=A0ABR2W393_9FUNG